MKQRQGQTRSAIIGAAVWRCTRPLCSKAVHEGAESVFVSLLMLDDSRGHFLRNEMQTDVDSAKHGRQKGGAKHVLLCRWGHFCNLRIILHLFLQNMTS